MFLILFVTLFVATAAGTVLLVAFGHRLRFRSRIAGILLGTALALGSGEIVAWYWNFPPQPILVAEITVVACVIVVTLARSAWNPIGQAFYGLFIAAIGTYIVFAALITFATGLPVFGFIASLVLFVLECLALMIAAYFVFEGCDVICRVRAARPEPAHDPGHQPMVSLQVAAYNEPPDMLIETIKSLEGIDYPNFEIVVIDNNTEDEETWRPVEEYCRDRPRVKFVHEMGIEGFKAGALNLVMQRDMAPEAEIIGIVDADYRVDPKWLSEMVGYFCDPKIAFVQTPQDYREYEGNPYLTACYDAYNYFFTTSMPFRNQRNSIIFAGTMGLIRRDALQSIGGWPEWCITEDAETSLRLLKAGHSAVYVRKAFGQGIMPLTFTALKSQRFRWAFGGLQILKRHFWSLLPGPRTKSNRMTFAQRFDYLVSSFMWFNDLLYLGFSLILLATAAVVLSGSSLELRPLRGAIVLLPAALIVSGVARAMWSLRVRMGIGLGRSALAFLNWLSLSWTVSLACMQHLFRSKATFLRTPKEGTEKSFWNALAAAKVETFIALLLWGAGIAVAVVGGSITFVLVLFFWQGLVYASSTIMSWLNVRSELSPELERRRRTEHLRERISRLVPYYVGAAAVAVTIAALFAVGGPQGGDHNPALFERPRGEGGSPLQLLGDEAEDVPEEIQEPSPTPPVVTEAPVQTPVEAPAEEPVFEPDPTAAPTTAPEPAPTEAPVVTPAPTP